VDRALFTGVIRRDEQQTFFMTIAEISKTMPANRVAATIAFVPVKKSLDSCWLEEEVSKSVVSVRY